MSFDSSLRRELAIEREVGNLLTIGDELERRKWQKQCALKLVQKVNEGKFIKDSVYNSRLIPTREIKSSNYYKKVKLFSSKELAFLNNPSPHPSSSSSSLASSTTSSVTRMPVITSSYDVYTGGIHRRSSSPKSKLTLSASAPIINNSEHNNKTSTMKSTKVVDILRMNRLSMKLRDNLSNRSDPLFIDAQQNSVIRSFTDLKSLGENSSVGDGGGEEFGYLRKYLLR